MYFELIAKLFRDIPVLIFVQPKTVIGWQRKRFRDHWAQLSAQGQPGRPTIAKEVRVLIGKMSKANPN